MTTATTLPAEPVRARALTALDVADCCGVQATYRCVILADDHTAAELLFCAHHLRLHRHALDERAAVVYDEAGALVGA